MYSRPFDDQTRPDVQEEAKAFIEIIKAVKAKKLDLLSSDILMFEVYNILDDDKRDEIEDSLTLCTEHIDSSEDVLKLGKQIQSTCKIKARDALHIASAVLGQARYFLSCDHKVTQMRRARCYRRLVRSFRKEYFSVMNPTRFLEKMRKGELS
jgi:predicted nucleic acid-binding protein